jgi:DNA-binding PadR family transcriptional regulator
MTAVFSHGRLRLYLLKLLAEGPRHGYELIRLLENQFFGLYAPSAGTIYPRLQRMETEGLVRHAASGGRKVYEITGSGRAELTSRAAELASLESDINASVADLSTLAHEVGQGVRGSVREIKRKLREATRAQPREATGAQPTATMTPAGPKPTVAIVPGRAPVPGKPPVPGGATVDLERKAEQLLDEVRRLARTGNASAETMRATLVVLDGTLDQVRRLLR